MTMMKKKREGKKKLEPLKVKCTDTACEDDLHCFRRSRAMKKSDHGRCRECGADLVDWPRVHKRSINDAPHTFSELRKEFIRHHFWHQRIDARAEFHARHKGRTGFDVAVPKRIRQSVGPATPSRDGRQTPFGGNAIYYAQHAVACCCRKCIEYWHNIPKERDLTDKEIEYFSKLVLRYLDERLPNLSMMPEELPRSVRLFEEQELRWPN